MQPTIETLSIREKRSLLATLLKQDHSQLRMSITQERLWQLCQLQPGTPLYNFQTSLELQGWLVPEVLELATSRVVLRHEVLLISYGTKDGKPALSLSLPGKLSIPLDDLSDLSPDVQEQRLEALGVEEAQRSFDLNRPPLLRVTLARLAPDRHRLYLTMHHIVSDFLSLDLFLAELGACYSAALAGKCANLPPLAASYQDFAAFQRSLGTGTAESADEEYWRRTLAAARPIEWFSDHVRPAAPSNNAGTEFFNLPGTLMQEIETFARQQQVTPFMVLLTGFHLLLHACSGQDDLTVGLPMAGRIRSEYESLVGMFSYPVLMRTHVAGCQDFLTLLLRVRKAALEAAEHGNVPFARVADLASRLGVDPGSFLRATFSYVSRLRRLHFEGLLCRRRATNRGITDLDFFMTIYTDGGEWHGVLEYSTDLFERQTVQRLVAAYIDILRAAVADPALSPVKLAAHIPVTRPARLAIAATFTADPLLEVLAFWARALDLQFTPVITPYNQLLQQLLDLQSPLFSGDTALNVLLLRPEDWIRSTEDDSDRQCLLLRQITQDFISAARGAIPRMRCPLKIYLCPASSQPDASVAASIAMADQSIRDAFFGVTGVEVLYAHACAQRYSIVEVHDPQTDRAANIPYKPAFFVALGTMITRQFRTQVSWPFKVLVLDCDNTLWHGLCAEAGPQGVVVSEGHQALQRFVLQQATAGVLVCLNSKNVPEHVFAVFHENRDMILKESDISAFRINWEPKSDNLESLAAELQLGLDSFVFIDDDIHECAEISARFPQVLTLRLGNDPAAFPGFLQHVWAFDRENVSEEDRQRAVFYRDNQRRDLALRQATSLADFLATLDLRVDVRSAAAEQILRIAQLSQRTNQFNASGIAFNALQLKNAAQQGMKILAVEARDRFGEYGLVGSVMYRSDEQSLTVEGFYLSCRVLGRGVEHRVVSELGHIAEAARVRRILIQCRESSRNQPFRRFLDLLPGRLGVGADGLHTLTLSVTDAIQVKISSEENTPDGAGETTRAVHRGPGMARNLVMLSRLPHDLATAAQIQAEIDSSHRGDPANETDKPFVLPRPGLEDQIASEWKSILRVEKVGRNDNFFERGGNSLLLVQLNGNLVSGLGIDISMAEMFQYPTVASLAAHIQGEDTSGRLQPTSNRGAKNRAFLQKQGRRLLPRKSQSRSGDDRQIQS